MFRNYFKTALRSIRKNASTAAINLTGLTAGITCCLLMVLYVGHELRYDRFHANSDRIVRVIMQYGFSGAEMNAGNFTSTKVLPAFKKNFPEVESGVRMEAGDRLVKYGEKIFNESRFYFADSTFFDVFSFPLLNGVKAQALNKPNTLVISRTAATKYFGTEDPVGKVLLIGSRQTPFTVTGVAADCPSWSQIRFDFVASFISNGQLQEETYFNANYTTYLLLKNEAAIGTLQAKIPAFMKNEVKSGYDPGTFINFLLEPFTKIHLYSPYDSFEPNSNIKYIYIICAIALLILMIACFTYINLSTARSMERAKEVGVRKVSGAMKGQVFWQFICESLLLVGVAVVLSLALTALLLPAFNNFSGKVLSVTDLLNPFVIGCTVGIAAVLALLAGSYPALMLSRFQPVKVLKGAFRNTRSGSSVRKSLTVFQFSISVFLIVCTLVINQQLKFIQNKKLGYVREQVIDLPMDAKMNEQTALLKTELGRLPGVTGVSKAVGTPVRIIGGYSMRKDEAGAKEMTVMATQVDENFVAVSGLELIAGTSLTAQDVKDASKDSLNYFHYILNESAVKALGWTTTDVIGKKMYLGEDRPGEVRGVVKDFHFESMHSKIQPLVLFAQDWGSNLLIKMDGKNVQGTLAAIDKAWKGLVPHRPFEFQFLDDKFNRMYETEMRTGKVLTLFSGLAILLACLGLFGLSVYSAQQRIKEIGVRKVLGASVQSLILLLSGDFLVLVVIAIIIAVPAAALVIGKWMEDFAYRTEVGWWMYLLPGLAAIGIAFLTVGIQALKAALTNPVKNLRTE